MYVRVCVCTQTNFAPYTWPCFAIFILCHKPLPNAYNRNTHTYICTEKLTLTLSRLIVVDVVLLEGERGVSFCMTKQNPRQRNNLPKIVRRLKCRLQQLHTHIQKQKKKQDNNNNKNHWSEGRRCGKTQTRTTAIKMQSKAKWTHRKDRATKLF